MRQKLGGHPHGTTDRIRRHETSPGCLRKDEWVTVILDEVIVAGVKDQTLVDGVQKPKEAV